VERLRNHSPIRHLGPNLHPPIPYTRTLQRRQPRTLHGVNHRSRRAIANRATALRVRVDIEHPLARFHDVPTIRAGDVECAVRNIIHRPIEYGVVADVVRGEGGDDV